MIAAVVNARVVKLMCWQLQSIVLVDDCRLDVPVPFTQTFIALVSIHGFSIDISCGQILLE